MYFLGTSITKWTYDGHLGKPVRWHGGAFWLYVEEMGLENPHRERRLRVCFPMLVCFAVM